MLERLISAAGLLLIMGFAVLISNNRKQISWRVVGWGVSLQVLFALIILKTGPGLELFKLADRAFRKIYDFAGIGVQFLTFKPMSEQNVAVSIAATLVFVASLMAVLYYLRVIQVFVYIFSRIMQYTMKISGAEALSAAMFTFMGIESITALKKYIKEMTQSELFTVMTGFMATIAGTVMAIYAGVFGAEAGHLLAASIMSAPAAILLSKIMIPETGQPATSGEIDWESMKPEESNIVEAASNGAMDGVKLAINIVAMLLAFVALVGMMDYFLGKAGWSFELISSYAFAPFAFIAGVPWEDCLDAGRLLGIKVIFNEFLAYMEMKDIAATMAPRSVTICTYALCSFANFGSLAILIGGISSLVPERKSEVARLGMKALLAGFLAGLMTATVAGIILYQ